MNTEALHARKEEIRQAVRARRQALTESEKAAAQKALTEHLITLVTGSGARSVSCYLPIRSEPDPTEFIAWARENGIRVLLPACRADMLLDWVEPTSDATVPGLHGIPEPIGTAYGPIEVGTVDLMLVPACAVAEDGTRLGWGGGYFDRTLGSMQPRPDVFALLHDDELVTELPHELHDIPVTGAVMPSGVRYLDRTALGVDPEAAEII